MADPLKIAVIVGSLREKSFNRMLAEALVQLPEGEGQDFRFVGIGDLPLYNQDQDADQPAPAKALKAQVSEADAVIFVTPEYNRSIPGVLKNAIDHGSRPLGKGAWMGKPAGILGISPGATGTAMAQQHLRNVLAAVSMQVFTMPEVYVQYTPDLFGEDGLPVERTRLFLGKWLTAFLAHVRKHAA